MADPYVRGIGELFDLDEHSVKVGVDYDSITIGAGWVEIRFSQAQAEEFAQLFVSAVWQAGHQAGYGRGRDDEAAGLPLAPGKEADR